MTNTILKTDTKDDVGFKNQLRLWLKILKASRLIENELRERFRIEFNTTLPRFDVLAALHRHESGMKMSALSGELKVSNGNVTGIVDRLVSDGMIVRVPVVTDRRAMVVRLTKLGQEEFAKQAEAHEAWLGDLLGTLDNDEIVGLTSGLTGVTKILDERTGK